VKARLAWIGAAFAILALSGCAGFELHRAERTSPPVDSFLLALRDGYLALSRDEFREADYRNSDRFAWKAELAASGQYVVPEPPSEFWLPADKWEELADARNDLVKRFENGSRALEPRASAEAQLSYDCWIEEQEENREPDEIAACRERFMTAMQAVRAATPTSAPVARQATAERPANKMSPATPKPQNSYTLYFAFDGDRLNAKARQVIGEIGAAYRLARPREVAMAGYADRAGSDAYNDGLSLNRVNAVATALAKTGIPESAMHRTAWGEQHPAVPTPDGVPEARNRRVVVTFK
jgi:OOP family OmpA-OmpF porin